MKTTLLSLILATTVLFSTQSCKKSSAKPATPPTTNAIPPPPVMSAQDSLVGNWIMDRDEMYNNGVLIQTTMHNDPVNCHLDLQSSVWGAGLLNCIYAIGCNNTTNAWKRTGNSVQISTGLFYPIDLLTTSNLVIQLGSIAPGGAEAHKYYFHK